MLDSFLKNQNTSINAFARKEPSIQTSPVRIRGFDLARGLAIIFMVFIHVFDFYGQKNLHNTVFGYTLEFLGRSPAAPVFMFIMGTFIVFPKRRSVLQGLKRALLLFSLGYALNVMRGTIPMWLSLEFGLVTYEQLGGYTPLTEFLVDDILQFAGIAYGLCILGLRLSNHAKYWAASALIIAVVSPLMWKFSASIGSSELLKLLWGSQDQGAMFPVFPWLAFPFAGVAFGLWFQQYENKTQYFRTSMFAGCGFLVVGTLITLTDVDFHMGDYFRSGPGVVIWNIGFVLVWLWLCHWVVEKLPSNTVFNVLFFWSRHVTTIYVVQWVIIGWGLMILGSQQLGLYPIIFAMFGVLILSVLGVKAWLGLGNAYKSLGLENSSSP